MELELPATALFGFSLALVRTTAFVSICPPFNSPAIPVRVRVGIATAIAFVIATQLGESVGTPGTGPFVLALLTQALAGFALGFGVLLLFSAVQAAGDLIDFQVGFSLASVVDPLSGAQAAPIARFHQLMAIVLLFAINGHLLVVRAYLRSVEAVPGGELDLGKLGSQLTALLGTFMIAAVEIGLPVLAALFCAEIALGLLGKAAPQLNILVLGFAVKTIVAIALLGMTLVFLPEAAESLLGRAVTAIGRAFGE